MERFDAKLLGEVTAASLNSLGFKDADYADEICRAHKTLQQSWMRMVVETCRLMAKGTYDLRNEAAHNLAVEIARVAEETPLPFI